MSKHLPMLHNPLLNALFNNPQHSRSPLRKTIAEIAQNHNDYTIVVPPAHTLHTVDPSIGNFEDMCYHNDDFVRSHVLHTASAFSTSTAPVSKTQSFIYNTLNGKQVLFKQGAMFTGKGFRKSIRLAVVNVSEFVSFCDYFPKGARIALVYVDGTLFGPQPERTDQNETKGNDRNKNKNEKNERQNLRKDERPTFENLLRTYPPLSQTMSSHFYDLFHHNNKRYQNLRNRQKMPLSQIAAEFHQLVSEALDIVQQAINGDSPDSVRSANILNAVLHKRYAADVTLLVHEYVELHLYDRVWMQLVSQYEDAAPGDVIDDPASPKTVLTAALYRDLSCLSLNQLDLPVSEPWHLNVLYRRVADAIKVFSSLASGSVSSSSQKVEVVQETVDILTNSDDHGPVIDADTLIGLLIMVVVHSKVPNLECHLYYIRHFGYSSKSVNGKGFMSYILSNFDAVIYHLHEISTSSTKTINSDETHHSQTDQADSMSDGSARNYEFWYAIQRENLAAVEKILDRCFEEFDGKELPKEHFIRSKNINGESCFHFAVRSRNTDIFMAILSKTEQWFWLEDVFFDENTSTKQSLLMVALQEGNSAITDAIIDVIVSSATPEEQILYFNAKDSNGRTVGHYLAHDLQALKRIGPLVEWTAKDSSDHTPLFSLCRTYDQPDYVELVATAFSFVTAGKSGKFTLDEHTDKSGNTLLHALARGIPESGLLSNENVLVDINEPNKKGLTPTALSIRYNRLENLRNLLQDKANDFAVEDPRNLYTIMDYYSFSASKNLSGPREEFGMIERVVVDTFFDINYPKTDEVQIGAMNAKFDAPAVDWMVNTAYHQPSRVFSSKYIQMDKLRQFYKVQKLTNPLSFLPNEKSFWVNFPKGKVAIPICSKYRCNRLLEQMNMLFMSTNFLHQSTRKQFFKQFSRCCRDDSSVLEIMKDTHHRESTIKSLGNPEMSHQTVQEIAYFIEYSQDDLRKYKSTICRLNKLTAVGIVKQGDVRSVLDRFLHSMGALSGCKLDFGLECRTTDATLAKLQQYVAWLDSCLDELIGNCEKVVQKVHRWEAIYGKIREANSELRKFEDKVVTPRTESSGDGEHSDNDGSFFNFGLIDSKKSRYKKLLFAKSEDVKKLVDLSVEIRMDHETIASELSQFLQFRASFLTFGIKQYANRSLVSLRHRHLELSRTLAQLRSN